MGCGSNKSFEPHFSNNLKLRPHNIVCPYIITPSISFPIKCYKRKTCDPSIIAFSLLPLIGFIHVPQFSNSNKLGIFVDELKALFSSCLLKIVFLKHSLLIYYLFSKFNVFLYLRILRPQYSYFFFPE